MNAIQTTHNIDFKAAPWTLGIGQGIMAFIVGTCHGIYRFDQDAINIIAIHNEEPNNGHLQDVFEWFEYAAIAQNLDLIIRAFHNEKFKQHCINKRGFEKMNESDLIKKFKV